MPTMIDSRMQGQANLANDLQIQMQGNAASVRFTALVSGGSGRVMPDSARAYNITSGWRKDDGKWRVYYAEWKPGP